MLYYALKLSLRLNNVGGYGRCDERSVNNYLRAPLSLVLSSRSIVTSGCGYGANNSEALTQPHWLYAFCAKSIVPKLVCFVSV